MLVWPRPAAAMLTGSLSSLQTAEGQASSALIQGVSYHALHSELLLRVFRTIIMVRVLAPMVC